MSQSNVIAGALLVGFIVFITTRGQLASYLNVVGIGANKTTGATTTNNNFPTVGVLQ